MVTFEGKNNESDKEVRGYVTPNLVEDTCYNISNHLKNVYRNEITVSRMVLYFKIDKH